MPRVHKYFRILYLGECKLAHYFDVKGAQIFENTLFSGGANIYYFDVRCLQGYPLCAIDFSHFLKGFSKEIDHLSLVDFFAFQNFSGKIWSLEFNYCFQLKES